MKVRFLLVLVAALAACAAPTPAFDDHLAAGRAALDAGDTAKAIAELETAVGLDPTRAEAQVLLGQAYYTAGRSQEARERLQTGLRQDPNNASAQYLLGDLSVDAGRLLDAATAYAAAVKIDPGARAAHPNIEDSVEAALQAGQDAATAGQWQQAIPHLEAALALNPGLPEARFALGNIQFNLGLQAELTGDRATAISHYAAAQADYEAVLELDPEYAPALTNLGVVAYQTRDLERAVSLFQQALAIDPGDTDTRYQLGAAYLNMDKRDAARQEFERALEMKPDFPQALIGLGNVYLLNKEYDRAVETLQRVVELMPDSPEALFALGKTYAEMGRCPDAVPVLQKFEELSPAEPFKSDAGKILQTCAGSP